MSQIDSGQKSIQEIIGGKMNIRKEVYTLAKNNVDDSSVIYIDADEHSIEEMNTIIKEMRFVISRLPKIMSKVETHYNVDEGLPYIAILFYYDEWLRDLPFEYIKIKPYDDKFYLLLSEGRMSRLYEIDSAIRYHGYKIDEFKILKDEIEIECIPMDIECKPVEIDEENC